MDVEPEYVKDGLESFIPDPETAYGRMRLEDVNGINIINDCYNANPVSMRVALETLKSFFPAKKKFAILGDMLELGSCSETEHINLIKYASDKADQLILFGREFKNALEQSEDKKDFIHIDNIDDLKEFIKTVPSKDDVVLVKGSRGMRLERIIEHLKYE
jgi:UDP-N-acetylmuramoyl-tripeptide--D-alanyl-D-alanine ligase